jgi:hypothetical protein
MFSFLTLWMDDGSRWLGRSFVFKLCYGTIQSDSACSSWPLSPAKRTM